MAFSIVANLIALAVLLFGLKLLVASGKKIKLPLPPGPRRLPLVGNIRDLPPAGEPEWLHWAKHKDLYGPVSSVDVFGSTIVILNDVRAAVDLLEKRSNKYSSRPRLVFAGEMCGWEKNFAILPYNDRVRQSRKQFHAIMGNQPAVARYIPLQELEVNRFLLRVLKSPEDLLRHIRTEAGALALKMAYGYTVDPTTTTDPRINAVEVANEQFSLAAAPGWLVDALPALKQLPDWFPLSSFKRTAREYRACLDNMINVPWEHFKTKMSQNRQEPCLAADIYKKNGGELDPESEDILKWSAGALYGGGADTTVSTVTVFFLAMNLFPDIQARAQNEIDAVVGTHRLPDLNDRDKMPYVDALVSEALRWHTIAPIGLPHLTTADDVYNGHFIPKGSMVFANIWMFCHEPTTYRKPHAFNPDRFLGAAPEPDPRKVIFGFGRRICPGRFLADQSVWLTIAKCLAAFKVEKSIGVDGVEVQPEVRFMSGFVSHPAPFKTNVSPRSPRHADLIRDVEKSHPWEQDRWGDWK